MDFFESLAQFLLQNRQLQRAVEGRIYPHVLPQEPILPAIVYTPISTTYGNSLGKQTGFVKQIVQFTIHDKTFGKARQIGRVLRAVVEDYKGNMNGINIQATHTLADLSATGDTMTNFNLEDYTNILEFEFDYMEE